MLLITLTLFPVLVLCSISFLNGTTLYEGDRCRNKNPDGESEGRCLSAYNCSWALRQIKQRQTVDTCNFQGRVPIICCPINHINNEDNSTLAVSSQRNQTNSTFAMQNVKSIAGHISQLKCSEYYPHPEGRYPAYGAYAGKESLAREFPHMAALGFGTADAKQWKCGGSLISLQHVLTAAHCLYSRELGNVKYVRLGDLNLAIDTDQADPQDFTVKRAIMHPSYDSRTMKNDIAIIELDKPVLLTDYVKPACLYLGVEIGEYTPISATGWGVTEFSGNPSNHLLKVQLKLVDKDECQKHYLRDSPRGDIDDFRQVCAGSADDKKNMDTCQGDSGGPLQLTNYTSIRHYHIIGITSFGKACGITKSPGVYTRVISHLSWIESIVYNS